MSEEWEPPMGDKSIDDFLAEEIYKAYGEFRIIWPPDDRRVFALYLSFAAAARQALSSDEGQPYLKRMLKS